MGILDSPDRWIVEWSPGGRVGKRVTLINKTTGQRATGRHASDWDEALRLALREVERQGDLVTEVERYLGGSW